MLKFFKKMEKTRNFILIVFAVLLVASLIVFGALSSNQAVADLTRSTETVAEVGSEEITVGEIATQVQGARQAQPASELVDNMIDAKVVKIEAEKYGLTASDAELADAIREQNKTPDGKPIDQERYKQNAVRSAGSVAKFEEIIRDSISAGKLQAFVTSGVTVSEQEVLDDFKRKNTKLNLTYVPISAADIAEKITPSDEELKKYFEENKKDYYIGLPQKKIKYLFLETAKVSEKLEISEADLKAQYDKLSEENKQAGVNVQEIVLRVPKEEFDAEVQKKANELTTSLKKDGENVSEEKFAEIAKGQSESSTTAQNGGRVDGLVRRATDPSKQDDPYQRILNMKEGEVTEPIKYKTNYYILRRGKAVQKSFEDMKSELEASEKNRKAYSANSALAGKVAEELKKSKDVEATAAKFASEANMSADEMIFETDYVKAGDNVEGIGVSQDFEQATATLEEKGAVGEKFPLSRTKGEGEDAKPSSGFAIPVLIDKKEPRDATFEEVADRVKEAVKVKKAKDELEKVAKAVASSTDGVSGLSSAASSNGLEAKEAKDFVLGSPLGEGPTASTSKALEDKIYAMSKGDVTKEPIKVGDNYFVVGVNEREEAKTEDFEKQRDQLYQQMLMGKRSQVFEEYLFAARQRMQKAGEITIYKDAVAKVDNFAKENAPPPQPQQPQMPQMPNGQQLPNGQQISPEMLEQIQRQMQQQQPPQGQQPPPPQQPQQPESGDGK